MDKKFLKGLVTLTVISAAVAAAVTYVKQYTQFNKNLDDDFYDFEDEKEESDRKYTALKNSTDDFISSAKETANVAKGMLEPAKEIINEVSQIVVSKVKDVAGVSSSIKSEDNKADIDLVVEDEESIDSKIESNQNKDSENVLEDKFTISEEV